MTDNHKEEGKTRKEEIHQQPDQVEDEKQQPVTPEPPQRKHPQAKPERDERDRKS